MGSGRVDDAALLVENGTIAAVGGRAEVEAMARGRDVEELDLPDCTIVPGFVDAHAHPLFAGDREPDFAARLRGEKAPLGHALHGRANASSAAGSGGVLRVDDSPAAANSMLAHGTTTLETKTGYALHKPGEAELLDIIAAHRSDAGVPRLIATFLGAHALPPEFVREGKDAFVDYLIDQVMPLAAAHGAVYADAFCEPGFFSPEQTRRYLDAARQCGMRLRVHCDEMAFGGAAEMAVRAGVDAVDHCNYIRDEDVRAIAAAGIVTVACPATIAYLELPKARRYARCSKPEGPWRSRATITRERRRVSTCKR